MNVRCAARKNFVRRRAVDQMSKLRGEGALAAAGRATNQISVGEPPAFLRAGQVIERDLRCKGHSSGTPEAATRRNHPREIAEAHRNDIPYFLFNLFD